MTPNVNLTVDVQKRPEVCVVWLTLGTRSSATRERHGRETSYSSRARWGSSPMAGSVRPSRNRRAALWQISHSRYRGAWRPSLRCRQDPHLRDRHLPLA